MRPFTYEAPAQRVVFGRGTIGQVADEVRRLGRGRALVLSTPPQETEARRLAERLGPLAAGTFAGAVMHTPVEVTERAVQAVTETGAACVVPLGGGGTTGLGKAVALRTGLDQVVVPTTIALALGTSDAAQGLYSLVRRFRLPTGLDAIGMPADGLDQAADQAVASPYPNPVPLHRGAIRALLGAAYDGTPPRAASPA